MAVEGQGKGGMGAFPGHRRVEEVSSGPEEGGDRIGVGVLHKIQNRHPWVRETLHRAFQF